MRSFIGCAALGLALLLAFGDANAAPIKDQDNRGKETGEFPDNFNADALLVAHLRVGEVWSSPLFKGIFEQLAKTASGKELLADAEKSFLKKLGFWLGDVESAMICITGFTPKREEPIFAAILTTSKPLDKDRFLKKFQEGASNRKGFIALEDGFLLHFPDDRTAVIVQEDLAERYLEGYAKDKNAWPMNKALKSAAEKNDLLVSFRPSLLPAEIRRELGEFAPALGHAKQYVLAANLKGTEIRVELRGSFPDDEVAGKAKSESTKWLGELVEAIAKQLKDRRTAEEWGLAIIILKELQRAIRDIRVEQFGSDLVAKTVYKADFPFEKIVMEAAERKRLEAERGPSRENLKELGLAMHNYASASAGGDELVISGTDAKGRPIQKLDAKPLLSWRVAMLPYLEQGELYRQFKLNEAWDSEHNKKLIAKMPKIFAPVNGVKAPEGHTFYQMVVGPKAMRPGFSIATIPDGSSNTIAVVEASQSVIWTKPDDIFIPGDKMPKDLLKKFGGLCQGGFNVLMYDGSVRWVNPKIVSEETLWRAIQPDDGLPLGSDWD